MSGFFNNTRKPVGLGGKIMLSMMNKGHAPLSAWGMSHISGAPDTALDIGCGGGANIRQLLTRFPQSQVDGIDHSSESVKRSTTHNRRAIKDGRCRVRRGDVTSLPFEEKSYDLATAFETVYFWPDIENAFRQVLRVLKPGGHFLICNESNGLDPAGQKWASMIEGMTIYPAKQLCDLLQAADFVEIEVDQKEGKPWLCITARRRTQDEEEARQRRREERKARYKKRSFSKG